MTLYHNTCWYSIKIHFKYSFLFLPSLRIMYLKILIFNKLQESSIGLLAYADDLELLEELQKKLKKYFLD